MRNSFRKFSAIAAGLALSLTLTAPAFAATIGADGTVNTNEKSLSINKAVIVANDETTTASGLAVAYPSMTFSYTVSPVHGGAKVTQKDANGNVIATATVKDGVNGGVTLDNDGKINIESGVVTLNANGVEAVNGKLALTIDPDKFAATGAGIYRYKIEDTTNVAALNANGVTRGAGMDKEYFLDVYLTNTNDGGLEPGGYVLLDDDDPDVVTGDTSKQGGIDDGPVDPVPEDPTPNDPRDDYKLSADATNALLDSNDYYETFNATLTKSVTGTMGDKTHEFPFTVELTNNGLSYKATKNGVALSDSLSAVTSFDTKLANDGVLKIWGLSPLAKVNFTEKNDTISTYKTSVADASTTLLKDEVEVAANGKIAAYSATQNIVEYKDDDRSVKKDAATITFTNKLDQISPTGVVLRFAPYVAMLAASMILLLGFKSNKAYEEE